MIDPRRIVVYRSIITCWAIATWLTVLSVVLWFNQVEQLANWFSFIPAVALLTSLFAMTASAYLLSMKSVLTRIVLPMCCITACWSLAMAVSI